MSTDLGLYTNKMVAVKKQARTTVSQKTLDAIESGDVQAVIDSLSPLAIRFVEEYLQDPTMNATQAVVKAGYGSKHPNRIAFQLMENPGVRIAIDALRAQRTTNSDVSKDFVLKGILKAINMAEEAKNLNALLRGHELLARHLGMFIERTEISGPDGEAIRMEQKTKQDVADFTSRLSRLAAVAGAGGVSKLPDGEAEGGA